MILFLPKFMINVTTLIFPFLDGDVPCSTSYGVYISQLIRFARASSYVTDFNTCNKLLTQKKGYRYHKLRKTFSKFYRRYYDLISKFQVGLKSLLRQGLSGNRLHACWSTQSRLATLLFSLIARRWDYEGYDFKTYLLMRW